MLRVIFEAVEKALGPSLASAASLLWAVGLLAVALQVLAPLFRVAVEAWRWRARLSPGWLVGCRACSTPVPVAAQCLKCGAPLGVPALARFLARPLAPQPSLQRAGWVLSVLGAGAFLAAAVWLMSKLTAHSPLERLLAGASLVTWSVAGNFLSRAFGSRGGGPVGRLRDLLFACGAVVLLSGLVFLEQNARVPPQRVLARLVVSNGTVQVDGTPLPLHGPELGLELQLIEGLGVARVLPLAWVGATRSPIALGTADGWLRDFTWEHAGKLRDTGVAVKRRTETFPVFPGERYEVVLRERDVVLERGK